MSGTICKVEYGTRKPWPIKLKSTDCGENYDALTAFAVSKKLLYFPVPTINLDFRDLPATLKISFFKSNHLL